MGYETRPLFSVIAVTLLLASTAPAFAQVEFGDALKAKVQELINSDKVSTETKT